MHNVKQTADRFDAILDSYYQAWFRYHPVCPWHRPWLFDECSVMKSGQT
ncbi:MAG: hypothetical protein GXP23_02220 [Gammaproteobacteria bacterium]|nr:hypothetical protein [Gammaproteobacteria bacterium]